MSTLCAPAPFGDLLARFDRPVPRYTSYPPVPAWQNDVDARGYADALAALAARPADPLALYVHLPFCATRCLYCGCNAIANRREGRVDAYLDHLEWEAVRLSAAAGGRTHPVYELHLGGGTPNLLTDAQLRRLDGILRTHFALNEHTEQSIEADPRLVTASQIATLAALGFTRISYGVQDLDPAVQAAIGRVQPLAQVRAAVALARAHGFGGINLDVMYGLPRQTPVSFGETLEGVLALDPDRIAVFGHAHLPQLLKHQRAIREDELPGTRLRLLLFRQAVERLEEAGYVWIGLDHFAKPDDPMTRAFAAGTLSRNFMGYTTQRAPHLLGLGASSISEIAGRFVQHEQGTGAWESATAAGVLPLVRGHRLTEEDERRGEAIRLLMCDLVLPRRFAEGATAAGYARVAALAGEGLVRPEADGLHVTRTGRFFLRVLAWQLDAAADGRPASAPAARMSRAV